MKQQELEKVREQGNRLRTTLRSHEGQAHPDKENKHSNGQFSQAEEKVHFLENQS